MNAMRSLTVLLAVLTASTATLSAQDTIRFKDSRQPDVQGTITNLSCKTVEYEIEVGGTLAKQSAEAKLVAEIIPDSNKKSFDFVSGESAMNSGDFKGGIERFERVRRDARTTEFLRQLSGINVVRCQWELNNLQAVLDSAAALRQQKPDTFYFRESYEYEIKAQLAKGNAGGALGAIERLEEKGRAEGLQEMAKSAELLRAGVLELQGKHAEALRIFQKYAKDRDVAEDATLGELRCLVTLAQWPAASTRAESVLNDARTSKSNNKRLITAAYNARGEALLQGGKLKEALLDFMQGATVLNKGGEMTPEHERSLARGAVACARFAAAQADKGQKDTYKQRAQELVGELLKVYPNSTLKGDAVKAIQEVK